MTYEQGLVEKFVRAPDEGVCVPPNSASQLIINMLDRRAHWLTLAHTGSHWPTLVSNKVSRPALACSLVTFQTAQSRASGAGLRGRVGGVVRMMASR